MAASFNGSTHFLGVFSAVTAYPFTMYVRGQSTTTASEQHAFYFGDVGQGSSSHTLAFRGDTAGDPMQFRRAGGTAVGVNSVAGFTANTWADLAGVAAAAADGRLYANNVKTTNTATSITFSNANVVIGGFFSLNSVSGRLNGLAACCAIWDAALTDDDISSLYKGFSPRRIRPQSLRYYAPLVRDRQDMRGGVALTVTGTAAVGVHPRSYGI